MRIKTGDKEKDIVNAAIAIFGEKGYSKTKMYQIAEKANIGIGTVYLYFRNKETILLLIFKQMWRELSTLIGEIHDTDTIDSLAKMSAVIDAVFDYFASNPSLLHIFANEQAQLGRIPDTTEISQDLAKVLGTCSTIILRGQSEGLFTNAMSSVFITTFFFGGIRNILLQWADQKSTVPLTELRQHTKTAIFSGIALHK